MARLETNLISNKQPRQYRVKIIQIYLKLGNEPFHFSRLDNDQ